MSASHQDETPDDHYDNEHTPRRRRFHEHSQRRIHYPGDGLDFRRPVMSASAAGREGSVNEGVGAAPVIDLTDEDGTEESQESERHATSSAGADVAAATTAAAGSSRAQRLPRYGRDIIDIPSSGEEEEEQDLSHLPGAQYLALPPMRTTRPHRPQFSSLRRPARPPSPPADMDDIEFLSARPVSRPRTMSRQTTPATAAAAPARGPRSVTPYPTNIHQPIDLTGDNDDDVMVTNIRQREGVNRDPPAQAGAGAAAGAGTRSYGHLGHIANLLREEGANLGGRLVQRLGFGPFDGELRAQQQAFDHFNHNHDNVDFQRQRQTLALAQARQRQRLHQHHTHHHGAANDLRVRDMDAGMHVQIGGGGGGPERAAGGEMQIMMDYDMTGFDMGLGGNRPPTPKYSPPPEPQSGFTRSPEEDEVVVCPNCGDELAMGDSDEKQEVWVVKACGHVS